MKQVTVSDSILAQMKTAIGGDVDPSKYAVFRAVALNTLPIRQRHPLYLDAVHPKSFLNQMKASLSAESRPLYINHDSYELPIGRVFAGDVVDHGTHSELQVLFWVDKAHAGAAELINSGTVDQVSVSVLAKKAISNKSGFDFFGEDATSDHVWSGTDPEGNVMGKDGAHVILQDLADWYEMSLVGRGGARGARILGNEVKLAASGQMAPITTLTLSTSQESKTMELTQLVTDLTAAKAENLSNQEKITAKDAEITALKAQVADLQAKVDAAPKQADLDAAVSALKDVAKTVAVKCGDVDPKLPDAVAELGTFAKDKAAHLTIAGTGSKTLQADAGKGDQAAVSLNAFRRRS